MNRKLMHIPEVQENMAALKREQSAVRFSLMAGLQNLRKSQGGVSSGNGESLQVQNAASSEEIKNAS
jgi:hypothetical protein